MAAPPQLNKLPQGVSGVFLPYPLTNVVLHDIDARNERFNVLRQQKDPTTWVEYPSQLNAVKINNSNNPDTDVYLKIYDSLDPAIGTDNPEFIFMARAGKTAEYVFPALPFNSNIANFSYVVVTVPGTAGTSKPSNSVQIDLAIILL